MVYLKKANWEDLEKEWLFVREMPEEEIYLRVNLDNPASLHMMLNNGGHIVGQDGAHFFVRIPNPGKEKKTEPLIE